MKVVVAGASGQVATCLAKRAAQRGILDVVCLGRPVLDLGNPEAALDVVVDHSPGILINVAAYTDVERAEDEPDRAFAINEAGARAMAAAARKLQIPLIHVSTDYVYPGDKIGPYVETDAVGPINAYGRSKLAGEQAIQAEYANAIILRASWIYSQFGKNFLTTIFKLLQTRDELNVVDDQIGCPTSAWDVADAILDACAAKSQGNASTGIYHLAGSGTVSWHGFACAIQDLASAEGGRSVRINAIDSASYPSKAKRPLNSTLQTQKIFDDFKVRLPAWQDSLAACVQQLKSTSAK